MNKLEKIEKVQNIAKLTMDYLRDYIKEGMTEEDIKKQAESFMINQGIERFWYHDVGALVLNGRRSLLSISGKEYIPSKIRLRSDDIITIDLSPVLNNTWGDYARTFTLDTNIKKYNECIEFINYLHTKFIEIFDPDKLVTQIHEVIFKEIESQGFESLDFRNNFGHSIEDNLASRKWFDSSNQVKFSNFDFFTFEPHIKKKGEEFAVKLENIYYFNGKALIPI